METPQLVILADNALLVAGLRHHLASRFSNRISIKGYCDLKNCLKHINEHTTAVVLDYIIDNKNGKVVASMIKALAPAAKIIFYASKEDVSEEVNRIVNKEEFFVITRPSDYKQRLVFS